MSASGQQQEPESQRASATQHEPEHTAATQHESAAQQPAAEHARAGADRPSSRSDRAATIVLLIVCGVAAAVASSLSGLLGFASDGCFEGCDSGLIAAGMRVGAVGPWVLTIAAVLVAGVLLGRRQVAWYVPVVALVLMAAPFLIGLGIVESATS